MPVMVTIEPSAAALERGIVPQLHRYPLERPIVGDMIWVADSAGTMRWAVVSWVAPIHARSEGTEIFARVGCEPSGGPPPPPPPPTT